MDLYINYILKIGLLRFSTPYFTQSERCCLDDVFLSSIENGVTDVSKLSWLTKT